MLAGNSLRVFGYGFIKYMPTELKNFFESFNRKTKNFRKVFCRFSSVFYCKLFIIVVKCIKKQVFPQNRLRGILCLI